MNRVKNLSQEKFLNIGESHPRLGKVHPRPLLYVCDRLHVRAARAHRAARHPDCDAPHVHRKAVLRAKVK
jgi:hypothetical protein